MAANYPLAFGELLAGSILLEKGVAAFKTGLSNTSAGSSSGGVSPSASSPSSSSSLGSGATTKTGVGYFHALTAAGLAPVAAAGVVGNLYQESSLNPANPGGGLASWQPGWFSTMSAWVKAHGLDPATAAGQLAYIAEDLKSSYPSLLAAMSAAQDPADAALLFSQQYENPNSALANNANREMFATAVYAAAGY